jgi:hypothetical protein
MISTAGYLSLRLQRTRRSILALWLLLIGVGLSFLAFRYQNVGTTHALTGLVNFLYAPLAVLVLFGVWGQTVQDEVKGLLALGRAEKDVALTFVASNVTASAAAAVVMTETVLLASRSSSDPSLLSDMVVSLGVSALVGASYGAYFSLFALLLRNTRVSLLLAFGLLWTISSVPGMGLLFPHVHAVSLLGGTQAVGFHDVVTERASSLWLCGAALLFSTLSFWRITRARSFRV